MQRATFLTKFTSKYWILFLSLFATLIICFLKIQSLHAWQYTSDLFIFDTFLHEIVFNQRFVEFTYGNQFGDHAYLILFLLAPAKLILQSKHIYLLLVLNPILFFISSVFLYRVFLSRTNSTGAIWGVLVYISGFGILYGGLMEGIYGFHPDLGTGFLLISLTCVFILQTDTTLQSRTSKILEVLLGGIFLAYKEEMAILGLIYFLIIFLITKKKRFGLYAVISLVVIIFDFILIKLSQTPFNRSNTAIIVNLINGVKEYGLKYFFINPLGSQITIYQYWGLFGGSLILFHLIWITKKKTNPFIFGLFYTGIAKLGMNLIVQDFRLYSWHGLPATFMIISAIMLLILDGRNKNPKTVLRFMISAAIISGVLFFKIEAPYLINRRRENLDRAEKIASYSQQLQKLSDSIPTNRIVAIPMFSAVEMINKRFSLYPRGIDDSPVGIADYAILPRNVSHIYTGNFENLYPIENYIDQFHLLSQTKNFQLYQRYALDQVGSETRIDFFNSMGLSELIPLP